MSPLIINREGPVTTLTLNRPEKRNALNQALLERLCGAVDAAGGDSSQRVLVLRGAGSVFCSGLDLQEASNPAGAESSAELVSRALRSLCASRLVTIAVVQGAAIAGGAGLMTACDLAVALADAKLGYPEVRRGIVPALIMTLLRRQIRERDARELLLLGEIIDARRALAIGLLNRIAEDAASLEGVMESMIQSVLQGAPAALAETKKLLGDLWPVSLDDDLEQAQSRHLASRGSAEAREGIAAFNAKRRPSWVPES